MVAKKGILRPNLSIEPEQPAQPVSLDKSTESSVGEKRYPNESEKRSGKKFKNQAAQIKLSEGLKNEFNAIKQIKKSQFDYQTLELLIDHYVQDMNATDKKKFKALTED